MGIEIEEAEALSLSDLIEDGQLKKGSKLFVRNAEQLLLGARDITMEGQDNGRILFVSTICCKKMKRIRRQLRHKEGLKYEWCVNFFYDNNDQAWS